MATVTVGCKIPNGIVLRTSKPVFNPRTKEQIDSETTGEVFLVGTNGNVPEGSIFRGVIGQVAFTEVDEAFWSEWCKSHSSWFKPFKSGAIFASETGDKAKELAAQAADRKDVKSGLEAIEVNLRNGKVTDGRFAKELEGVDGDEEHLGAIRRGNFNAKHQGVG